jgi:NAD(P)-dependent dehydrogenase (short-subunit alcohol dehydrogenase family)
VEGVTGVALVTDASLGLGRGIALALVQAGYLVYATGRDIDYAQLPKTVIRLACDETRDEQTAAVFSRISIESGRLDVLVNSLWGERAAYVESQHASRLMVRQGRGLIVNISYWELVKQVGDGMYGTPKAESDRMSADMAQELRPQGVAVVSLYPGRADTESPEFTGRVIAALAGDPKLMRKSGEVLVVAALALEYGVVDVDGKQPRPITIEEEFE